MNKCADCGCYIDSYTACSCACHSPFVELDDARKKSLTDGRFESLLKDLNAIVQKYSANSPTLSLTMENSETKNG